MRANRIVRIWFVSYCVGGGALGRIVPSALVTRAIRETFEPSFDGLMSMVTISPGVTECRDQPARDSTPGARPSHFHSVFPPFPSSTVRTIQVCGLTHWKSLTTPVTVMTFVTSNATLL